MNELLKKIEFNARVCNCIIQRHDISLWPRPRNTHWRVTWMLNRAFVLVKIFGSESNEM